MGETRIYEELDRWICRINDKFGRSLEYLTMMFKIIRTCALKVIRIDRGGLFCTIVLVENISEIRGKCKRVVQSAREVS